MTRPPSGGSSFVADRHRQGRGSRLGDGNQARLRELRELGHQHHASHLLFRSFGVGTARSGQGVAPIQQQNPKNDRFCVLTPQSIKFWYSIFRYYLTNNI